MTIQSPNESRRDFLTTSAAVAGAAMLIPAVHAAGADTIRVGLIGCGSRGTGAASQALLESGADECFSADVSKVLANAEKLELYSLDPGRKEKKATDGFRRRKILGKTTLSGDEKKSIVESLQKGVAENRGSAAWCFNPRHGIKATHEGKTVELVICFECLSIDGWCNGSPFRVLTTASPAKEFNRVLLAKKVPLPKEAK